MAVITQADIDNIGGASSATTVRNVVRDLIAAFNGGLGATDHNLKIPVHNLARPAAAFPLGPFNFNVGASKTFADKDLCEVKLPTGLPHIHIVGGNIYVGDGTSTAGGSVQCYLDGVPITNAVVGAVSATAYPFDPLDVVWSGEQVLSIRCTTSGAQDFTPLGVTLWCTARHIHGEL